MSVPESSCLPFARPERSLDMPIDAATPPNTLNGQEEALPLGTAQSGVNDLTVRSLAEPGSEPPEISIRVLWSIAMYIRDRLGASSLDQVAAHAGITIEEIDLRKRWISIRQLSLFFASVRELLADDRAMEQAFVYRLGEAYGLLRYVFWASSPRVTIRLAARTLNPVVTSVCEYEVLGEGENFTSLRFKTARPEHESRQFCASRRAQTAAFPTFWGLPPARVEEAKCICWGDDCCEYHFRWQARPRWLPSVAGAVLGAAVAALLHVTGWGNLPAWVSLALLGASLARVRELLRANRMNLAFGAEIQDAFRQLADEAAEAKQEIVALHQRQEQWTQQLEEQIAERTAMAQNVVERIQRLREVRETNLRGFSHDLRNPMAVMRSNVDYLRMSLPLTLDQADAFHDMAQAVTKMDNLLVELMETATSESRLIRLVPAVVDVEVLADQLRRRARALVHGRDIRVSVFRTHRAPGSVHTDAMSLDRVMDNLLTNAAKYTDQGSILVELDGGAHGSLTVRVSDTGRGITPDKLPIVFRSGGSGPAPGGRGYGVGLSVVVQLMAQIGGRLEVLSRPGHGTTFWAHFPAHLRDSLVPRALVSDVEHLFQRVVTIRQGDAS